MFYERYTIRLYHFCSERYAEKRKKIRIYDKNTRNANSDSFHIPRQGCGNAVKCVFYGAKWGRFLH